MFHPRAEPAPTAPHHALGRAIPVGSQCVVEVDGRLLAGTYCRRKVQADALSVRQVVVIRMLGTEREREVDAETITSARALTDARERERFVLSQKARSRMIALDGRPASLGYLARRLGVTHRAITGRIDLGWSPLDVASRPPRPYVRRQIEHAGRRWSISALARELGMPGPTLDAKLRRHGFDLAQALAEPWRPHPHAARPRARKET